MAQELLVIGNPRRKTRRKSTSRRRSSHRKRTYHVRRNPTRRRSAALSRSTPVRRSRRRYSRVRRYSSAARRGYSRFRGSSIGGFVSDKLVPGAIGAFGALGLDLAWGYVPLPAQLKQGVFAPIVRLGGAVAIGYAVGMVAGKRIGQEAMAGAVIVTLYDLFKTTLKANTSLQFSGMGYINPGIIAGDYSELEYDSRSRMLPDGLGMFVGDEEDADPFDYGDPLASLNRD